MFIGRDREILRLEVTLDAALAGRGGLRLLSGEAGIGKTRLVDELVTRAMDRGFLVSWGRACETGGAPAYWPWVELLGPLAEAEGDLPLRVRTLLGSSTDASLSEGTRADPARERFELFESVSSFVRTCARGKPLLLVFDDLHVADAASLDLLAFVARGLKGCRAVVLGTYRDAEARLPRVAELLSRIMREGETLPLRPLSRDEVAEVLRHETGRTADALAATVHDLTEGNPLFVHEMIHALNARAVDAPLDALRDLTALGGVLALVRERLAGSDQQTRTVLEVASVLGREPELGLLVEVVGTSPSGVRCALEDGSGRGLLVRRSEHRFAFAHVLVREALYRQLSSDRRCELHRACAVVLDERVRQQPDASEGRGAHEAGLAALAHHALAALPQGDPVAAVLTAARAAAQARTQLAYEDAIALLERALSTCEEYRVGERERAEILLALGWASTEAGKLERGREVFRAVTTIARRLGDPALLARAALGQGAEYVLAEIRAELVDVLQEALGALEQRPGVEARRLRARLLARLAAALTPSGTPEEPLELARQALQMTAGETDARTRIDVDVGVGSALMDFAPPPERILVNERLLHEARRVSDRILELRALTRLVCDHLERGDGARADAALAARAALAESIGHPRYQWQTPLLRSMRATPRGQFDACEAHILEARTLAAEASDPNAQRCIEFHRFSLLLVAGRPEQLRDQETNTQRTLVSLLGNADLVAWLEVVTAARLGDKARTARALRGIGPNRCAARAERVSLLESAVFAEVPEVYESLAGYFDPADDSNTCWGPFAFVCGPPLARTLALVAFARGQNDEALGHCQRALDLTERLDADAHRAWVHLTWGEGTGARDHLERALGLAERLTMPEVAERARVALSSAGAKPQEAPLASGPPVFTLRHDRARSEWSVEHAGSSFQLRDVRGLGMLAQLVDSPGQEIHALELASEGDAADAKLAVAFGDAGEVIDARARDSYKARIAELREELVEVESWNDCARAERLRAELEALTGQLAAALGLGGRERRSGSAAERARVTVQRRIREAIKKIADRNAELGRHLDRAVRTGTFCIYEPFETKR